jgi:Fe-S-cluster containining protein
MKKNEDSEKISKKKCISCGNCCCRYFTMKIPAPRSILDFDNLLWQLYHENTKAFKDSTGWYLLIYNSCVHLMENGECFIYENRPITCREHSHEECEFDNTISDSASLFFDNYQSLAKYCKNKYKTWNKRY